MIEDSIGREARADHRRDLHGTLTPDHVQEMKGIRRQIMRFTED